MIVISTSYGNDSLAMIQWCIENGITEDVYAVYIDTGWASEDWWSRVVNYGLWAAKSGIQPVTIKPDMQFEELIKHKKGFPNQRFQWCSGMLKGIPFLNWLDEKDPDGKAIVLVGKRREESRERANTPCITISEYHGDRLLIHPLYDHTEAQRDDLLHRAGIEKLPHRSHECQPCVNANRSDLQLLSSSEIQRVEDLEKSVGKTMFRPKRHNGAKGIREVHKWACYGEGKYDPDQEDMFSGGCGSPFGCGL